MAQFGTMLQRYIKEILCQLHHGNKFMRLNYRLLEGAYYMQWIYIYIRSEYVTLADISKRIIAVRYIQKQGYWVPYKLKPRDVES